MKKIIILFVLVSLFAACEKDEPDATKGNGSTPDATTPSSSGTSAAPQASFSFQTQQPFKVTFTNTSTDASTYKWEFGDGQTSSEKSPVYKYAGVGVYKVKLHAISNGKEDVCEKNVKVEAPSICNMTGFVIKKIPTVNKYYQLQLTDDYIMSKTTYLWTSWMLLSSANMPYTYTLKPQKQLNLSDTYVLRLYQYTGTGTPSNSQASGKGDYSANISPSQLQKYPESLLWSNSSLEISILFQWK